MSIKVGSRIFAPQTFTTLLTIVLIALLISLGRWQLRRADEKRVLFDSFAAGTDATRLIDLATPALPRYQHIEAGGHYDQSRQVLIDNMVNAERAGYFVITPFALTGGGWVLVNRGWVPLGASRAERPAIPVADDARRVRGRADHMPSPGIQLGAQAELEPPYPVVARFPSRKEIARLLREILLDSGDGFGAARPRRARWLRAQLVGAGISAHAPYRLCGAVVCLGADLVRHLRRHQSAAEHADARCARECAMNATRPRQDRRQRRMLIGLALLFFAPLGAGLPFVLRTRRTGCPGGRVNAGELVDPARPLPSLALPLWDAGDTRSEFPQG